MTDTTHACPYCDLVFQYHMEIKDHIVREHPEHADVVLGIEPREVPRR